MGECRECLECIFGLFVGLTILIITNLISLVLTLALFPILVPTYMVKGNVLFTANFFNDKCARHFFGRTSKYTILLCYWLLCPVWIIPKTLYNDCKTSLHTKTEQSTVNTVTRQMPHPKDDPEERDFQMAILQSQLFDMSRKIDQITRNQSEEQIISVSGMKMKF